MQTKINEYKTNLIINPDDVISLVNLGKIYLNLNDPNNALPLLQKAVKLYPHIFLAQNYLADAYYFASDREKALKHYKTALLLQPNDIEILTNMSVIYSEIGEFNFAYECAKKVKDIHPTNFGILSLLFGDYENGWKYWDHPPQNYILDNIPIWEGEHISDKHILVIEDHQGFGDTILMARFLNNLSNYCEHITFLTRPNMERLIKNSFSHINVITEPDQRYDVQVRLFSLPRIFGTTMDNLPTQPYLKTVPDDVLRWQEKLKQYTNFKVGLCCFGSLGHPMNNFRSIFDTAILKSLDISDVIYFSIAKNIPKISELQLIDFTNEFVDFADTAAFLQNLDLIISVDTSIINLAGALGLPAILMNYYGHDWRWGITGIESIWYSAIRIIRQEKFNDWCPVIEQVRKHIDFWKENIP